MWRDTGYRFTMFSFYTRPWIVLVFPHLCFCQTWYIFAKVRVKLAKAIHIKMEVTQMCSPCSLTSSSILKSSGNSHYAGEIVWPFTVTADPWQKCNYGITLPKSLRQKSKSFLEFSSWRHIHTILAFSWDVMASDLMLKEQFTLKKSCHYLLTVMLFQSQMTFFLY